MTERRVNALFAPAGDGEGSGFGLRVAKRLVTSLRGEALVQAIALRLADAIATHARQRGQGEAAWR